MALDDANKRLFVGCRLPARLVVLDTTSGRIVTSLATVDDTDDVFYDPGRHVIGGEGAVEVLRQRDPDHYEAVRRIKTAPGARTGLFVPGFNRGQIPTTNRGSKHRRACFERSEQSVVVQPMGLVETKLVVFRPQGRVRQTTEIGPGFFK